MKDILKSFVGSLAALAVVGAGFVLILLLFIAAASSEESVRVPGKAVLVIDLTKPITDKPFTFDPDDLIQDAMLGVSGKTVQLSTLIQALRSAADDKRIRAVLLKGPVQQDGYASGWAALKELRKELLAVKEAGKPIIAYWRMLGEPDYYLASAADSIYIHPLGALEFNGFASQRMFFANAMKKYGIEMHILRVGRYKSAVEPYMLDRMSPAAREQMEKLLNDLTSVYFEAISESRGISLEHLQTIADEKVLLKAAEAVDCRMVDQVSYFDDVRAHLQELTDSEGEDDFPSISAVDYAEASSNRRRSKNRIAIIYAEGEIVDGNDSKEVGGDHLAELLRRAREDNDVKAVVMRVNSPGGSAMASEIIQRETLLIKEAKKPFVVSMGTVAASGGYWISTYADEIVAHPNTITGSIGVFGMLPNFRGLANEHGITFDEVRTHRYSDLGNIFRRPTQEEIGILQGFTAQVYDQFLTKVSEGRHLEKSEVDKIGQGRVWSGAEAQRIGLVDTLGGFEDAVAAAAKRAGLEADDYRLLYYQREKTLGESLVELFNDGQARADSQLRSQIRRVFSELNRLSRLHDPLGVYARLEYDLVVR